MEIIEKTETLDLFVQIFIDLLFKDKNIKLQFTSHLVYILFWSIVLLNEIRDPFSFKLKNKNSNYGLDWDSESKIVRSYNHLLNENLGRQKHS